MQIVPTQPDVPNYAIACTLDGTDYLLTFRYSERENCFYLDLALTDGTLLSGGRKVVCNWSLFQSFRYDPRIPQGALVAFQASGASDSPPGFDANGNGELGDGRRVQLYYLTTTDIAAIKAGTFT